MRLLAILSKDVETVKGQKEIADAREVLVREGGEIFPRATIG